MVGGVSGVVEILHHLTILIIPTILIIDEKILGKQRVWVDCGLHPGVGSLADHDRMVGMILDAGLRGIRFRRVYLIVHNARGDEHTR